MSVCRRCQECPWCPSLERVGEGNAQFPESRAEDGLENIEDSLYPYRKDGRPEWIRTIDLFRVKEALWTN